MPRHSEGVATMDLRSMFDVCLAEGHNFMCDKALSKNEQCESANGSMQHSKNFSPINLHYAPKCPTATTTLAALPLPPPVLPNTSRSRAAENKNIECTNCGTKITSAWRRTADGKNECNACNLFFRRNGYKRPASMRRDSIPRRFRLSRCNWCAMEAENNSRDFEQYQKLARPPQVFLLPKPHCSTQTPMTMSCPAERTVFSATNEEQQTSPSQVNDQHSSIRHSHSAFLGADVSGSQVVAATSSPTVNAVENEAVKEEFSQADQNTGDHRKELHHRFIEYPARLQLEERSIISKNHFEDQSSEPLAIMKEEFPGSSFLNCSPAVYKSSLELDSASSSASATALNETFGLFQDDSDEEHDETAPVSPSL
uniref:GATA-type domain-containing protein n=1 Tax=Angiostrongylus cantonensis TaxID=6313 RepID=A0A0K0DPW1_ANGCA